MNNKAINSHSSKNNKVVAETKLKTKNKTEYIEFCTIITIKELTNKILEKK